MVECGLRTFDAGRINMAEDSQHADWTGVGDSFRAFGQQLRGKLSPGDGSVAGPAKAAADKANEAVDDFTQSVTEALNRLSDATNDPQVTGAAKTAVNSLISAVRSELGSKS